MLAFLEQGGKELVYGFERLLLDFTLSIMSGFVFNLLCRDATQLRRDAAQRSKRASVGL